MRRTLKQLSVLLLAAIWLMACGEEWSTAMVELGDDRAEALIGSTTELVDYDDIDPPHAGADPMYEIVIESPEDTARLFADGFARLDAPMDFRQVSWMMDAHDVSELQYRAMTPQGAWTDWEDVHVYWSEGIMHNARILLDFPTREIQLRGGESIIATTFEFHEEVIARAEIVTAENQPGQPGLDHRPEDDLRSTQQAVAPTSLVIPRSTWRAINPSKVCGSVVAPYRMTIHHTAIPSGDGGDAAARMRGMQSHHINANGWCDIGYHFVVAQTGKIYQGRSRSNRPGAHTLNTNSGNVGIAFIANFQSQTPTDTQLNAGAKIVKWNHDKHGIALNRTRVKGHREWPGQSTTCPGANMINRISTILTRAAGSAPPPPPPPPEIKYDVKFKVNFLGLENFYKQGSSADLLDAMPGDTFRAEILITNDSDEAIRGVELGYRVYTPYMVATNYVIQTDHPAMDKRTWKTNSADSDAANPAKDSLNRNGTLVMHAFSKGETKRVLIDLKADQYSIGFVNHPNLRSWVKKIDNVYAQDAYGDTPTLNKVGTRLRSRALVDVLSRDEWQWKGAEYQDLEGWKGSPADHHDGVALNMNDGGLLTMNITGDDARLVSPDWTRIDADQHDQIVMTFRSHDGPHIKAFYWSREGESFSEDRVVRFAAEGDSQLRDYVIPVGMHPEWSGQVHRIRVDLMDDRAPIDNGWHGVGMIYFQSSETLQTTSFTEGFLEQDPTELIGLPVVDPGVDPGVDPDTDPDDNEPGHENNNNDNDYVVPPGEEPPTPDLGRPTTPSAGEDGRQYVAVNNGCSTTNTPGAPAPAGLLLVSLLGALFLGRRILPKTA